MCNEGLFFSCHDSYIWRLLILLIAENWWDRYNFFCSVMEDDLLVSSGTRAFREQPLVNDRQTGQGMASHRWGESRIPVSNIKDPEPSSISNNLLSFILFASDRTESSTSPPWALDCQLPHRWDIFMFQQLFRFCELTITLRRLDLRDAGDYDPRQRIHRCADIGHQLLHLPPLLFILLFFLLHGELSGTLGWASPAYLSHVTQLP